MSELSRMKCVPCQGDSPKLTDAEIHDLLPQLKDWSVIEEDNQKRLRKTFRFKDFASALAFTDRVGLAAETEDHHPVLVTAWGKVTVTWWTHAIGGLHQNDFIMAAKSDEAYGERLSL